jgi:hypothetical protein
VGTRNGVTDRTRRKLQRAAAGSANALQEVLNVDLNAPLRA